MTSQRIASICGQRVWISRSATSFRAQTITLAPPAASRNANSRPMPDVPPVTTTTRSRHVDRQNAK